MERSKWVGLNLATRMWIKTKAVCSKRCCGEDPLDLNFIHGIIVESVTWVTEVSLWEHEGTTDTNVIFKENEILEALIYEIEVLCPLQWEFRGSQHRLTSTTSS